MQPMTPSPEVKAVLKKHGATIVELTPSKMRLKLEEYSTATEDKVYNELRSRARVSLMTTIIVELP